MDVNAFVALAEKAGFHGSAKEYQQLAETFRSLSINADNIGLLCKGLNALAYSRHFPWQAERSVRGATSSAAAGRPPYRAFAQSTDSMHSRQCLLARNSRWLLPCPPHAFNGSHPGVVPRQEG